MEGLKTVGKWGTDLLAWAKRECRVVDNIVSFSRVCLANFRNRRIWCRGLWDGIKSMGKWIGDKVSGFVEGITKGVKGVLGITSPSRVFMGIGENISLGLARGIAEAKNAVDSAVSGLVPPQVNVGLAGGGSMAVGEGQAGISASVAPTPTASSGDMTLIVKIGEDTIMERVISNINRRSRISGETVIIT